MEALYLFTHAAADVPPHAVDFNTGLSEAGKQHSQVRAEKLKDISCIFSSGYRSAVETTYISAAILGVTWSALKDHSPVLPGKPVNFEVKKWEDYVASFLKTGKNIKVSEILLEDMKQQMKRSIDQILIGHEGKNAVIIAPSLQLVSYAKEFTSMNTYDLWKLIESGDIIKIHLKTGKLELLEVSLSAQQSFCREY
ncbi:hypothetical protein [Alkalicoccus daliensis]|uniref:Broad specificity phosphatase PhoE n=1 Tax=Alkalicoccus daliensis TaxID=745820 RepID=A0A1G9ZHI8_9BACI|nr:hypothetical protein [Alkalicoccus daliensis]SDN20932.1 Broad specificity phosphatase PhoE [Alkalicoccus daliensis]